MGGCRVGEMVATTDAKTAAESAATWGCKMVAAKAGSTAE